MSQSPEYAQYIGASSEDVDAVTFNMASAMLQRMILSGEIDNVKVIYPLSTNGQITKNGNEIKVYLPKNYTAIVFEI